MTRSLPGLVATSLAAVLGVALFAAAGSRGEARAAPAQSAPQSAAAQCLACHSVTRGGAAMMGPNLFGVVDSPAAAKPGYAYSAGMKASKIRWSRERLNAYLADPMKTVPGTRMAVPGISDAQKRKAIIDYLVTLK